MLFGPHNQFQSILNQKMPYPTREGFDKLERRVYPNKLTALDQYLENNKSHPFYLTSSLIMPSSSTMIKAGTVQVMIDHAYIACAIEAYKHACA